jgi:hypothetical protein
MASILRFSLYIVILTFVACQSKKSITSQETVTNNSMAIDYPEAMDKIFAHHGGLDLWKKQKAISYAIKKESGDENQWIDLQDRRERIEAPNVTMGYDGANFWMESDTTYKGNPIFYKNLMFYFYAMPFVVADQGIIYNEVSPLEFDGKSYPGMRISYEPSVGVSPEDEYFIHYDPDTGQMVWLGYTVTYFSKEKSKKIKWIQYNDWQTINGLKLPNALSWYKTDNNKPTELRNTVQFGDVTLSTKKFDDSKFLKTVGASIVEE